MKLAEVRWRHLIFHIHFLFLTPVPNILQDILFALIHLFISDQVHADYKNVLMSVCFPEKSKIAVCVSLFPFQAYSQSLSKVYERELREFFEAVKQRTLPKGVKSKCWRLLRSRYENATPNLCWVFCALLGVLCN